MSKKNNLSNHIKVNSEELSSTIKQILTDYGDQANDALKEAVTLTAKDTVKELRDTSPKRTGKYAKGWRVKQKERTANGVGYVIHNATDYQLTHLLERGHASVNGGRVKAEPHIGKARDKADAEVLNELKERLK